MAEFTNSNIVTVAAGQNLPLTETAVKCGSCIAHREGAGIVTPISIALAIAGEPLNSATAIVTPAAAGEYFNVFTAAFIDVPRGCCITIAVENTSAQAISIANSNLIAERVA